MAQAAPIIIRESKRLSPFEALFGLGILLGGGWWISKKWRGSRAQKAAEQVGNDPDGQIAVRIRTAIEGIGTDTDSLYQAAGEVKDWQKVSEWYRKLYHGRNIADDLKDDLNAEEYKKFFDILNLRQTEPDKAPPKAQVQFKKGDFFVADKDVQVRKSPSKSDGIKSFDRKDTRIKLGKAGQLIGKATGKVKTDTKNKVLFYEANIAVIGAGLKPAWVAASQLKTVVGGSDEIRKISESIKKTPDLFFSVTKDEYEKADTVSGLGQANGLLGGLFVVAAEDTQVRKTPIKIPSLLRDNAIKQVRKGQMLGCATGRFSRDEMSNTLFYEVSVLEANKPGSSGLYVWVERKDAQFLHPEEFKKRIGEFSKPGSIFLLSKEDWDKVNRISRIGQSPDFMTEIKTTGKAVITSDAIQTMTTDVPEATLLGYKIMEMDNGKGGKKIKFQSLNGINWWVDKENIKELKK